MLSSFPANPSIPILTHLTRFCFLHQDFAVKSLTNPFRKKKIVRSKCNPHMDCCPESC